jgi:hypothetical protein
VLQTVNVNMHIKSEVPVRKAIFRYLCQLTVTSTCVFSCGGRRHYAPELSCHGVGLRDVMTRQQDCPGTASCASHPAPPDGAGDGVAKLSDREG